MPPTEKITDILTKAGVYGSLAKALGSNVEPLYNGSLLEELAASIKHLSKPGLLRSVTRVRGVLRKGGWSLDDLRLEHTRLFVKGEATPYETSFDTTRPFGKTHELSDVAGFYRAFGVKPSSDLPDYIVCELEFMGLLCLKEGYALAQGRKDQAEICVDAQRKFVKHHLGRWLDPFTKHVEKRAKLPVYPALVDLTRRFVTFHAADLEG